MDNLKYEYARTADIMIGENTPMRWWHLIFLSPIVIPMAIIDGICNFFIGTLPDMVFGIHYPEDVKLTPEEIQIRKQRYQDLLEQERNERVEQIRQRIFPNGIFPEDRVS